MLIKIFKGFYLGKGSKWLSYYLIITSPPTHGQTSNGRGGLSLSVGIICNTHICNVTHQGAARGGPVVLRPVRAT